MNESYDISLISQWAPFHSNNQLTNESQNHAVKNMTQIILFLNSYFKIKSSKKLNLILRTNNVEEIHFLKVNLNLIFSFIARNKYGDFTSYIAGLKSKVVLTMNSTLGLELISLKKNVIFYNPINSPYFETSKYSQMHLDISNLIDSTDRLDEILNKNLDFNKDEINIENYADHADNKLGYFKSILK